MNIINRRVDCDCLGVNLSNTVVRAGTVTFKGVPGVPVALPAAPRQCEYSFEHQTVKLWMKYCDAAINFICMNIA